MEKNVFLMMKTLRIYCKNILKFFSSCILGWWGGLGFHPGLRETMRMRIVLYNKRVMLSSVTVTGSGQVCWYPGSVPSKCLS